MWSVRLLDLRIILACFATFLDFWLGDLDMG